jgi:hypothetical protein
MNKKDHMLSHFEHQFLTGKIQLEGQALHNARYRIRKKLENFAYLQLPLLSDYERKSNSPLMKRSESVIILRRG